MTKIVHVITGLGMGGAETMLVQLAVGLKARGVSQHVVSLTAHDTLADNLRAAGVDFTSLDAGSKLALPGMMAALGRVLHDARPKIFQGWMYHGNIAATLSHYACSGRQDRKLFWNLRASNMDDTRYRGLLWWGRLLSSLPDTIIANSEAGAAFHSDLGYHAKQLMVIANGIDTEKYRVDAAVRKKVRAELGVDDNAVVVVNVARVDPMKDHGNFLAAMAQVPSVVGLLVGNGTQDLAMPPNVRALGLRNDVARLLTAGDVVASTSAFGEGFSNAIGEGMSAGLIPVATDVGDARRIVGDTGFIVPPREPGAFAAALATVASWPAEERARRGLLARERIVARFALNGVIDRYMNVYEPALAR